MNGMELFQRRDSWLHRLDPRVKLAITLSLMALSFIYQNLWFLISLFAFELVLFISSKLSLKQLSATMIALLPVSLLMLALRWLFYPAGQTMATIGPIELTLGGLAAGAVVALRILTLALAVLLWLGATSNQDVVRSLVALGLPYSWGLSFALALRFLPDFFNTYRSIELAQQSRGLSYRNASIADQLRLRQPILIAMLIASFRRTEQLAVALEARAFGNEQSKRTQYKPLKMMVSDWLILSIVALAFAALLAVRIHADFGSQAL